MKKHNNMSLIDKFYKVFPDNIVFQILTYKPHDCALLIKKDLEENYKNIKYLEFCYTKTFTHFRQNKKLEKIYIIEKQKLKDYINFAKPKISYKRNIIQDIDMECGYIYSCKKNERNERCLHWNSINQLKEQIKKYEIEIKKLEKKCRDIEYQYIDNYRKIHRKMI